MDASFSDLMEPPGESGRISSVFSNPNYYGAYLASMSVLAMALLPVVTSKRARAFSLSWRRFPCPLCSCSPSPRGGLATLLAGLMTIAFVYSLRAGFLRLLGWRSEHCSLPVFSAWRFEDVDPGAAGNVVDGWRTDRRLDVRVLSPSSRLPFRLRARAVSRTPPVGSLPTTGSSQVLAELGLAGIVIWGLFILAAAFALKDRPLPARVVGYSILVILIVASMSMSPAATNFRLRDRMIGSPPPSWRGGNQN